MVLSTPAQLVAPVVVARGTLSITTTEIYFEVDEEDSAFKKTDAQVRAPYYLCQGGNGFAGICLYMFVWLLANRF